MIVYQWRDSSYAVPAEVVAGEIERITRESGVCTPESLVDAAADPGSPIHGLFEWDDEAAARSYRVVQARRVIRSLEVVRDDSPPTIAYVSVQTDAGRGYLDTATIAGSGDLRAAAVAEAVSALKGWTRRAERIKGLERTVRAVNKAIEAHEREAKRKPRLLVEPMPERVAPCA
jgi:hypothetical protein